MSSRTLPQWDVLKTVYTDEFGPVAPDIYTAAGNLWPKALDYSSRVLHTSDPARTRTLLLKSAAQVTRALDRRVGRVENLDSYLFLSFKRVVLAEREKDNNRRGFEKQAKLDAELHAQGDNVERRILLGEIVDAMDDWTRHVFEWLTLDYTYEEIGQHLGMNPKVVRTRFYRQLSRIRARVG